MASQLILEEIRDTLADLHETVNQLIIAEMPKDIKAETVVEVVLKYAGMTMKNMTISKKAGLIFYKRIMCYIMYDYCNLSYQAIANTVFLANHATVKHHVDKMRWWMANPQYAPADVITATRNILNALGYEKNK